MSDDKKPGEDERSKSQDYYWENGLMVFTEKFHLRRGYCCKSGCRHCPYGFEREAQQDVKS